MDDDDILGPAMNDAEFDALYTLEELRVAVQEGLDSGTNKFQTMAEIKAEAHRRFDSEKGGTK